MIAHKPEAGRSAPNLHPALCVHDPMAEGLAVGAYPGFAPRLVLSGEMPEDRAAYQARGGYGPGLRGEPLIEAIAGAGLRGRGGAAFPTAIKLGTVRAQQGAKFLVANGEEGEPASVKDRWLMRKRPHLVLDGVLRASEAIEAKEAFLYVSDPQAAAGLRHALAELGQLPLPVHVFEVAPGYVAGEETSVVRALNGGPAKPTDKPPRPYQSGVGGCPTLVTNVETLANIPYIAMYGAARYRDVGDGALAHGSMLMTIGGAVERPGLYEVPFGTRLGGALEVLAAVKPGLRGFLMGGYFAGLMNNRALDLELNYDLLRDAGSGLGCGAIIAIGAEDCPIAAAGDVMAYFARENAGQCGACFRGTPAMAKAITALGLGEISDAELERLLGWSVSLRGRGACATLDGAAHLAATIFREFPEEVSQHRQGGCPRCQLLLPPGNVTRFSAGTAGLAAEKA